MADEMVGTMSEWQPIETAPNSEGLILVWDPAHEKYLILRGDDVAGHRKNYWWMEHATHWMPLPAPPT